MPLNPRQQSLIDILKALPPNSVYTQAEKRAVFRGFQLYTDRRVSDVLWGKDEPAIAVRLIDDIPVSVRISPGGSGLAFHCSRADHGPEARCEHVVCALLTLLHLLRPNLFRMTRESPTYRDHLLAALFGRRPEGTDDLYRDHKVVPMAPRQDRREIALSARTGKKRAVFRIVLEEVRERLRCSVERDGERVEPPFDRAALPPDIAYLMNFALRQDMSVPLALFLRRSGNIYPILYKDGLNVHPVEWVQNVECATWTELDTSKDEIVVKKACAIGEDGAPAALLGNFAFNRERTRMTYVEERGGWSAWETIREACLRAPSLPHAVREAADCTMHIPKGVFTALQVSFQRPPEREAVSSLVCKMEGIDRGIRSSTSTAYRLTIRRAHGREGEFTIRPECLTGGYSFLPLMKILSLVRIVEWGHVPISIRTRKRKPILYDAFFQALAVGDRKAQDEIVKKAIHEEAFGRRAFVTLARRFIRQAIAELKASEGFMQLHLTDEGWQLISADREKEISLFSIPYRLFGHRLFERMILNDGEMVVGEGELLSRLYELHAASKEQNIELHFEDQPVEPASWEFELDATNGSIDWFEVRPEIRCNGLTIPRELWEQALARKGVILRNGAVQVLDEKTLSTLKALVHFAEEGARGGAREIVSIPRLKIIDLFLLRRQGITVRLTTEDEEMMVRLTRFDGISQRPIPKGLRAELRQYQQEGYYWLSFLYEYRFGACLADDMGLGKTIQALALLQAIREGMAPGSASVAHPSLVVLPPSLIFNWEQEIERFCPDLKVYVYRGKERSTALAGYDVIITSYGLVRRDIRRLRELTFNVVVFDEAQNIKNIFAHTTGAVRQLKALFKVALTGTPVENHIGEYYSIMDLVLPGLLGEYREFQGQAKQDMGSLLSHVTERTKPFVLRRTKEHILKELPPKVEHDVYLDLTDKQKRFYNRTVEEVRSTIDHAYGNKTASQAKIIALTAIMKLRQICLSPQLLVPDQKESSPKVEFLREMLAELYSESHSALVFSQFTSFLDIVQAELEQGGFRLFRLDGSTPVPKRKRIVEGFQKGDGPAVFLLSLKAGGQGLNLTRATYVYHLDPWWNPAVETQASDRSHRIGQKNKVIVTRLLMRHTVEEKMMALKQRKMGLYRVLLDAPEKSAGRSVSRDDFDFLLRTD
jgi:superfamily II DNA or RNA helicase